MGLYTEGIRQAQEASEIFERLGYTAVQAECFIRLACVLLDDEQPDAAEEAASRAIDLPEKGDQFLVCEGHRVLGDIYRSKGDTEKAIHHFGVAPEMASPFNWHSILFWVHFSLAELFLGQSRFDDAHAQVERAKSHVINNAYQLGCAMDQEARIWYKQGMFEKARLEASHAVDVFEKLGAAQDLGKCRELV